MIQVGERVPEVSVYALGDGGPEPVNVGLRFRDKKVVLFAVPGAYTPTCHKEHFPGYIERAEELATKGVDEVFCLSVNDPFVMDAWARELGAGGKVVMLADGNGVLTRAMGLDIDLSDAGLGVRSKRYSAVIDDCVVTELNVENDPSAHTVCSAVHLLTQL